MELDTISPGVLYQALLPANTIKLSRYPLSRFGNEQQDVRRMRMFQDVSLSYSEMDESNDNFYSFQ